MAPEARRSSDGAVAEYAGYATMIFMIGWASGGLLFGVLGDRIGRVRTMIFTILSYSLFTGLSAFAFGIWDFAFYRFLTGLGVGGQFAVGVALVAETLPDRARPFALGWLQAASTWGNMLAGSSASVSGGLEQSGAIDSAWRMHVRHRRAAGAAVRADLPPARRSRSGGGGRPAPVSAAGSLGELFSDPRWRRHAIVGMLLAFAGVVGLWGIGFFTVDLFRAVLERTDMTAGQITLWTGIISLLQNVGGVLGIYAFTHLTHRVGRRKAFAIGVRARRCSPPPSRSGTCGTSATSSG